LLKKKFSKKGEKSYQAFKNRIKLKGERERKPLLGGEGGGDSNDRGKKNTGKKISAGRGGLKKARVGGQGEQERTF